MTLNNYLILFNLDLSGIVVVFLIDIYLNLDTYFPKPESPQKFKVFDLEKEFR